MKVGWQDIGDLPDADPKTINRTIIVPAKEALRQTRQALTGNLTLRDNQYAAVMSFGYGINGSSITLISGTEYLFTNPLKTKPIGFTVLNATTTVGNQIAWCGSKLNTTRTDGLLGITITQDLLGGTGDFGELLRTAVLAVAATAGNTMTSNTVINMTSVFATSGTWDATLLTGFNVSAAATDVRSAISITSATFPLSGAQPDQYMDTIGPVSTNQDVQHCIASFPLFLASSTTVFGVSRATFATGSCFSYGRLSLRRMAKIQNPMIASGILWGG